MREANGSTRRRILHLLRKSEGGLTVSQLCQALQVTPMAVHRHLALLEARGLVASEAARQGRGRPVSIYKLTEAAGELFPKKYAQLLLELLDDLKAAGGMRKVRRFFERRAKRLAEAHRSSEREKDLPARVESVSALLNEQGYMSEWEQAGDAKFVIKLFNCPVERVARQYPDMCFYEQCFLKGLLGAKVTRDHHILAGQNYCSYLVHKK